MGDAQPLALARQVDSAFANGGRLHRQGNFDLGVPLVHLQAESIELAAAEEVSVGESHAERVHRAGEGDKSKSGRLPRSRLTGQAE